MEPDESMVFEYTDQDQRGTNSMKKQKVAFKAKGKTISFFTAKTNKKRGQS
jgi:hypothetical protein